MHQKQHCNLLTWANVARLGRAATTSICLIRYSRPNQEMTGLDGLSALRLSINALQEVVSGRAVNA